MSEYLLRLYNQAPDVFSDDQVDGLEEFAKANDLPFTRDPNSLDFSIGRTLSQVGSGFVSGLTTLKIGETPRNEVERIANSVGHLAGFVGIIPGAGLLGKGTGIFSKAVKGAQKIPGVTATGVNITGFSAPMAVTNIAFEAVKRGAKLSPALSSVKFFKDTSKLGNITQQALHLGTASAVSSWQEGVRGAMDSFISGSVAGGVFAGIPNFKALNSLVKSPDPVVQQQGLNAVRSLAGAITNVGLTAGMTGGEAPPSEYVYQFLLGAYFGYKTRPFEEMLGGKRVQEAIETRQKGIDEQGAKFEYLTKDNIRGYDTLPSESKKFVDEYLSVDPLTRQTVAKYYTEFEGLSPRFAEATIKKTGEAVVVDIGAGINSKNQVRTFSLGSLDVAPKSKNISVKSLDIKENLLVKNVKKSNTIELDDLSDDFVANEIQGNKLNKILNILEKDGYNRFDAETNLLKISKSFNRGIDQVAQSESFAKLYPKSYDKIASDLQSYTKYHEGLKEVRQIVYVDSPDGGIRSRGNISLDNNIITKMKQDSYLDVSVKKLSENLEWLSNKSNAVKGIQELQYIHQPDKTGKFVEKKILDGDVFIDSKTKKLTETGNKVLVDLAVNQEAYIMSGKKAKGTLQVSPFLVSVQDAASMSMKYAKDLGNVGGYRKSKKEFTDNMVGTPYRDGSKITRKQANNLYDRIFSSNIKLLEEMNGLTIKDMLKANKKNKKAFILDVVDFNNRMQLYDAAEPGLSPTRFIDSKGKPTVKDMTTNAEGQLEFNFAMINSKNQRIFDKDGSIIEAHVDGVVYLRHDVFKKMIEDGGFPNDATILKGTITSKEAGKGLLLGKLAYFKAPKEINKSLTMKKLHGEVYDTAIKQFGTRGTGARVVHMPSKKPNIDTIKYIGKDYITKIKPEDLRLNLSVYENPSKSITSQKVVQQLITTPSLQQMSAKSIQSLLDHVQKLAIDGDSAVRKRIEDHIKGTKKLTDKELSNVNIDDIPIDLIASVMQNQQSTRLYQHIAKKMLSSENEFLKDDIQTQANLDLQKTARRFNASGDRILSVADINPAVINHKWVTNFSDPVITKYIIDRVVSPKIKYSGKAIGISENPIYKRLFKNQEGEFRLGNYWKKFIINVNGKDLTLGDAFAEYSRKGTTKKRKKELEDAFEFVVARVPVDSISGIRALRFKGFTGDDGAGIMLNGRDMKKLGGMDLDIDSVFLYQSMPKAFRKELKKTKIKDEHFKDGKYIEAKSKQAEKDFTVDRWGDKKLSDIRGSSVSVFDPINRMVAGANVYESSKSIGVAVNSTRRARAIYEYEYNNKNKALRRDDGKSMRETGRSIVQIAADAKDYAGLKDPKALQKAILDKIYRKSVETGELWNDPNIGAILRVDASIRGRRWNNKKKATEKARIDEILQVINENPLPEGSPLWLQHYVKNMKKFEYDFNLYDKINTKNLTKQTEKLMDEIVKLPDDFQALIFKNIQDFQLKESLADNSYAVRNIISNGLSQLVSVKRLSAAIINARNKKATKEEIFDAVNFADQINYASYFAVTRINPKRLTPEAIQYIENTPLKTPNDINIALKERLDVSKPEIKRIIQEKLISNIAGPTPQEIGIAVRPEAPAKRSKQKGTEMPDNLQSAMDAQKAQQVERGYVADLQRFGFVSEVIPDALIKSWFKDYSNVYDAIQTKPTVAYAKQLLAGSSSKIEAVRNQISRQEKLNVTMNLLSRMPMKDRPKEIVNLDRNLKEIFNHHRDAYTKDFESAFLGTAATSPYGATLKMPRSLQQLDAQTARDFVGYWRAITNGKLAEMVAKKGMPLKWKDFFKFPITIADQHQQYDLQWARVKAPVKLPSKGVGQYDLKIPMSNFGKLRTTTQKSLEFYDGRADFNNSKIIDKYKFEGNIPKDIRSTVIDDAVALIEIKGADAQIYKDAYDKALANFKKYKNRKDVINIDGKNVKLSYQKLVETVSKKYEQDLTAIQNEIFGRTFANKKEFDDARINIMDETNPNHGFWDFVILKNPSKGKKISNIDVDATVSKRISSPLFTKRLTEPPPFIYLARLSDIIIKRESFTSKNSNKLVKELNDVSMDAWFKKWERKYKFKGVGFAEGYYPHIGHLPGEVNKYMQRKLKQKEEALVEQVKQYTDNVNSPDGGMSDPISRLIMNPTERARRTKENDLLHGTLGMRTRPQNLLSRDINDPTPGYRKGADVLSSYQNKILKASTNHMIGLSAYKTIKDFSKLQPFGKDTVQWERFMKIYTADNLGYPSVMPQRWADDPNFAGNKKSFYYKFTDKYIFDRLNKHSKNAMGNKKWYSSPEDLSRKLNHFSIVEGKYQLFTLLFNTRTFFNNMAGGNINNIISAGFDNMFASYSTLDKIVPRSKGDPIRRGYDWFKKKAEEHGAVETFLTGEFKSNPIFGKGKTGIDFQKEIQKLKDNNQLTKQNIIEIGNRLGISGRAERIAGSLMRISEERLRTRSYWMHYKKALEIFNSNGVVFKADDPLIVDFALRGSQNAQFLYNNAQRPAFSRTSLGRVFSRFQVFTWNSIRLRKNIYKAAKGYGFDPNTPEFDQFKRMMLADMFIVALASYYPASMFENTVPAPYNILTDLADVTFGDEKERERAFFGTLPAPFNVVQAVAPPSARILLQPLGNALKGDWSRWSDYQMWNMIPGGMIYKTAESIVESPLSLVNKTTGLPLYQMAAKARDRRTLTEEEKKKGEQE